MEYQVFLDWLINDKKMEKRSAKDVVSRCKRVCKLTDENSISEISLNKLILMESFQNNSMFIKSQLKRAVALYMEFLEAK